MTEYSKSFAIVSAPTGEPVPEGYPKDPMRQLIKNDFTWAAANRDRILEEWNRRYGSKSEPKS
jgi:iron(III) transport system substrate-binding protein